MFTVVYCQTFHVCTCCYLSRLFFRCFISFHLTNLYIKDRYTLNLYTTVNPLLTKGHVILDFGLYSHRVLNGRSSQDTTRKNDLKLKFGIILKYFREDEHKLNLKVIHKIKSIFFFTKIYVLEFQHNQDELCFGKRSC